ncbi:kinase subunit of RNA polymerase II carboxy-terminal domain kinase I [Tulasnella sp. JGI-2019a]|nr:kinase subunit of RNA polymerase II carboxy-terminal domain kinase I [Tulasnella sp. JGI-2019a]KAG9040007.1 kinase subunit of RNA polymerase II carboxy-terminal domain kinase I [Tulasnella sp. JGI-2019a]
MRPQGGRGKRRPLIVNSGTWLWTTDHCKIRHTLVGETEKTIRLWRGEIAVPPAEIPLLSGQTVTLAVARLPQKRVLKLSSNIMYGGSRSLRDNRDRGYEDDGLVGSTATEDSYYRGGSHRDRVPSSSTHPADASSRSSRYRPDAEGGGGVRTSSGRARSPYAGDDRWIPRDKLPSSTHSNYSTTSYSRSHTTDNGYGDRRSSDEHYRSGGGRHEEPSWPAASRGSRDDYRNTNLSSAAHDSAWDHPRRYSEASNHTDGSRHGYASYPNLQGPSQPRRENGRQWIPVADDGGMTNGRVNVDDRAWTRRGDDREWTRDDGRNSREDPPARSSTVKNGWEPPAVYPPEPTADVVKAKFVPGPGWRPDLDEPVSGSRGGGSARHTSSSWKHNRGHDSRRKDKDHGNGRHYSKTYDRSERQRESKKHTSRDEGSSKSDKKSQKRRRTQSPSQSRSRSQSRSASIQSEVRPLSPDSSVKRRRKASASPDERQSDRKSLRRVKKDRGAATSPTQLQDEEEETRGRGDTSRSRSHRRNSRSRSVESKTTAQKQGSTGTARSTTARKERVPLKSPSRSRSRSRSPSSSPQAALKTNGASKHRLPPSGPRAVDLMHVKIQPVSSTFMASSSRATVAAAYQRRGLVGEPPPGPRADLLPQNQPQSYASSSSTSNIPTGPKGVYPPPSSSQQQHPQQSQPQPQSQTLASTTPRRPKVSNTTLLTNQGVPAGPRSTVAFPMPVAVGGSALVKQFFPDDDEDLDHAEDGTSAQGGGSGFGVIPKRSKHPAGRAATPPASSSHSSRTRTVSPMAAARSPVFVKGARARPVSPVISKPPVVAKGVYERPTKPRTPPRSPSPTTRRNESTLTSEQQTPVDRDRLPPMISQEASVPGTPTITTAGKVAPPAELYQLVNQVGEGTFGKVYKARNVVTGGLVALKRIKVEAEKDGFPVTALREIKLLQSLSHRNVIYLHEMMVSKGNVYMVFDYMEHDLTGVLSQNQFQFSPAHLKSLCYQMLRGLEYLHHRGVIHRDMKGSNILVNSRGDLKLADFGLARVFQKRRKSDYTNRVITLWYRPPELLLGATVYGPEVDMWSAGTIMLELFTTKPVFQGNDEIHQLEVIYRILGTPTPELWPALTDMPWYELVKPKDFHKNHFRVAFQKYLPPDALDLAEGLLAYDTEKRLTATQALNMPYFVSEDPPMELPVGLSTVEGEWHELETKREREKTRKKKKTDGLPLNGNGIDPHINSSGPADIPTE